MSTQLNKAAFEQAKHLISSGKWVSDEKDQWSEHQPSAHDENDYLQAHGFEDYGKWYLGIETGEDNENKGRYKFPYSDFKQVHRCAVLAAENRAGQYHYTDIEKAAAHLRDMLEAAQKKSESKSARQH